MNVGTIITPTAKGQIVIPYKMRVSLGISVDNPLHLSLVGETIMMQPVRSIITTKDSNAAFIELLQKTAGSWAGDDWPKTEKKIRKLELAAAKRRKSISW